MGRPSRGAVYAPAEGRLAAAMATISARRRPIRDGAARNNEPIRRISQLPFAPAETSISLKKRTEETWSDPGQVSRARRK